MWHGVMRCDCMWWRKTYWRMHLHSAFDNTRTALFHKPFARLGELDILNRRGDSGGDNCSGIVRWLSMGRSLMAIMTVLTSLILILFRYRWKYLFHIQTVVVVRALALNKNVYRVDLHSSQDGVLLLVFDNRLLLLRLDRGKVIYQIRMQ